MTTKLVIDAEQPSLIPLGYKEFLEEIKKRIREAQLRASLAVNSELVLLYWSIGKSVLEKQAGEG